MKLLRLPVLMFASLIAFLTGAAADSLQVGDNAPTLSGTTDAGSPLNLGELYGQHDYTVVWFYPKALTGGCTKQGCSLRDAAADLTKHGATVVGVSTDTVAKQKEFKETNHFPFPLIADTEKAVSKAFGQSVLMMSSRECYVINRAGKIVYKDAGVTDQQAANVLAFLAQQKKG